MNGLFTETLIEFLDRKQHWLMLLLTTAATGIIYYAVAQKMELVENDIASQDSLIQSATNSLSNFMTFLVLICVISTLFLIPRLARKGRIEFYLSKPITRTSLFYGKLVSMAMIYGTFLVLCGSIVAGVLSLFGVLSFSSSFYIILTALASFFVWFVVVAFVGLQMKTSSMTLTVFAGLWGIQLMLIHRAEWGVENTFAKLSLDSLYYILPKTSEMANISVQAALGNSAVNLLPAFTSLLVAGILLYTTHTLFARRDF